MAWNEEKGRRFEELHNRSGSLANAERAELAALTSELEGADSAFIDDETKRKLTLASTSVHDSKGDVRKWIGIGAGVGGLLYVVAAFAISPSMVEHGVGLADFLFYLFLVCAAFGSLFALSLWVMRLKRRVHLVWLMPAWGVVCAFGTVAILIGPIALWAYVTMGFSNALFWALIYSILLSSLGFVVGMIVAQFKQRPKAELAALTSELEGADSAFIDDETKRELTLASTSVHDSKGDGRKWIGIGAGVGGLLYVVAAFATLCSSPMVQGPDVLAIYLFYLLLFGFVATAFGSLFALSLWVTRLKRRVHLVWLMPAWGVVCAFGTVAILMVPVAVWTYFTDKSRGPKYYIIPPLVLALALSILLSPLGFVVGMIVAAFKQRPKTDTDPR